MSSEVYSSFIAIGLSVVAVIVWGILCLRSIRDRRHAAKVMAITGLFASIGTLASALGFAIQRGVLTVQIDPDAISLVASMGRGALLMGGIIALVYFSPKAKRA